MIELKQDRANSQVYVKLGNLAGLTKQGIREGFFRLGKDLMETANKEILRKPKGGRVYLIRSGGGRKRRHVASKPGETHANRSGVLRRSLGWHVPGYDQLEFGYGVGSGAKPAPDYAVFVEDGTSRMAPRPSLGNAVAATERNAEKHFENGVQAALAK